ncbi:hypothetical protein GCM10023322_28010 [Rugosimonospora acidiphila]|uniref:Uncharacterized protein n=1 Tax=Rugosimonospora acidiphila TaxID=556531 RepID=A0ABP9RRU1_9ACTN
MADQTNYANYEKLRDSIKTDYQQLLAAADSVRAAIDATGPFQVYLGVAGQGYKTLVNAANLWVNRLTDYDWEFPRLASQDMATWAHIRDHAGIMRDLTRWMEAMGSDESTRAALRSDTGADTVRTAVQDALANRRSTVDDSQYFAKFEANQPVQSNGMRPPIAQIPLPYLGQHVPSGQAAHGNADGSPWAGLTGDSYRAAFKPQLDATQLLYDYADQAMTLLRTARGSYNDFFAAFKNWMWAAIAILIAFRTAIRNFWRSVLALAGIMLAAEASGIGAVLWAAVVANRVAIGLAAIAVVFVERLLAIIQAWVGLGKNLDTLAAGVDSFNNKILQLTTMPGGFVNGHWPDPTNTAEFPDMGRNKDGAWQPVTNSEQNGRDGFSVPPWSSPVPAGPPAPVVPAPPVPAPLPDPPSPFGYPPYP